MKTKQKPLFVPLKTEYFDQFARGEKTTEYRLYGPRWNEGTCTPGRSVTLSHGYSGARIRARVMGLRLIRAEEIGSVIYAPGAILAAIDLCGIGRPSRR